MPRIYISRPRVFGKAVLEYEIYLNNVRCDYLFTDELKYFELEPGKYKLRFKFYWLWSNEIEIDLNAGDDKYFEAISTKRTVQITKGFIFSFLINFVFNLKSLDFVTDYLWILPVGFFVAQLVNSSYYKDSYFLLKERELEKIKYIDADLTQ